MVETVASVEGVSAARVAAAELPAALQGFGEHRYPRGRNPARLYVASLAAGDSRATTETSLHILAGEATGGRLGWPRFPWHKLGPASVAALRELVAARYPSPSSANLRLSALRGVLRWCWLLELVDRDAFERAAAAAVKVRGHTGLKGRALTDAEMERLFAVCEADDDQAAGARDLAILRLLRMTGIRRVEIAGLKLADIHLAGISEHDGVRILEFGVVAKGNRRRVLEVMGAPLAALEAWIAIRGRKAGALFTALSSVGKRSAQPLSGAAIRDICHKRAREAGVREFNPHDLRRTVAGDLLDTLDVVEASRFLGHLQLETTARYDRRDERGRRRASLSMAARQGL